MNNFSLRFFHSDLEQQYQDTRMLMRQRIFFTISTYYLILNFILLIQALEGNFFTPHQLELYAILTIFILQILVYFLKNHILYGLTILNIIGCTMQFSLLNQCADQTIFTFGCNLMLTQLLVLQCSDFIFSIIQIIIIAILRISIEISIFQFNWFTCVSTIFLSIFLCFIQFKNVQNRRKQFLLTMKETHWGNFSCILETFLASMINKPFFYFEWDHSTFVVKSVSREKDIPIYKDDQCYGCNLRQMLREYQYQNETLETYLIRRAKKRAPLIQGMEMVCQNKKQRKLYITFTELFSDAHSYLIIFNPQSPFENKFWTQRKSFKRFLLKYTKDMISILTFNQSFQKIIFLNINYLSVIYINDYTIGKFYPGCIIQSIIHLLSGGKKKMSKVIVKGELELSLIGYKHLFTVSWLQITSMIISTQKYRETSITIKATQQHIEFQVSSLEQESLFKSQFRKNKILSHISKLLYCQIQQENLILRMHKDLDVSFNEYYLQKQL